MRVLLFIFFLWPTLAFAQSTPLIRYFHVQSGSGFFVNRQYVVTNAHVVTGCALALVKGATPEQEATVRVRDEEHDLALLETTRPPSEFAPLRFDISGLKSGDKVLVVGFPGEAGLRGEYRMADATIERLSAGDLGTPGQFFISDVVQQGNSGGPVFDTSGNVIGVVVAKSLLTTLNGATHEKIAEQHVGVAITLATLKQFLFDHGVFAQWMGSGLLYGDQYIEDRAKNYIVNIQCRTPTQGPDAEHPESRIIP